MSEAAVLLTAAASIAFAHTLLGPDHYLVFNAMARARRWSLAKTLRVTALCGVGHVLSSVLLGLVGIVFGAQLARLVNIESQRGDLAAWALMAFGLIYMAWGLRRAGRTRTHAHAHRHGDIVHAHSHDHSREHAHVHDHATATSITPWALFIIFILGPCEALIPILMYPAAQHSAGLVVAVAALFGVVTCLTMLGAVALLHTGLRFVRLPGIEKFGHAAAGASIVLCGGAISFLGW